MLLFTILFFMYYHIHDEIKSLMIAGVTVVVLHAKLSPYYNVYHEAISYCFRGN